MKYLYCALLLCGAFFSNYSFANPTEFPDNSHLCEAGETFISGFGPDGMGACAIAAPEMSCELTSLRVFGGVTGTNTYSSLAHYKSALTSADGTFEPPVCAFGSTSKITKIETTDTLSTSCPAFGSEPTVKETRQFTQTRNTTSTKRVGDGTINNLQCSYTDQVTPTNFNASAELTFELSGDIECPSSHPIGPIRLAPPNDLNQYCYRLLVDEPVEPPCDDIIGNCEEPPKCVSGGGGSRVCKADPDEKCWLDAFEHTQCEEGCGFLNDDFFCMTEPTDNPDFDKCKFTFNGYACPSEPNDDITDPEKPLPDMVKKDFKDVNLGVETRQDKTNDLLETQLSADKNNTDAIKGAIDGMNKDLGKKLDGIDDTLGAIGKSADNIDKALNPENLRDIPQPESWYESKYEDGIGGVWAEHSDAIRQTPIFTFLDQFTFAPSGTQPDWTFNFNLGALGNYGTKQLEVPSFIWAFIRLVVLLGATFTARRLIFGG